MTAFTRRGFLGTGLAAAAASAFPAQDPVQDSDPARPGRTQRTRFAVNVEMWWRRLPFLDRLRAAAELGFPAVELWGWRSKDVPAVAELTGELGLVVTQFTGWGFSPGLNETKNHAAFVDAVEAGCETAATLRAPMMTIVAGNDVAGMSQAEMLANVEAGLALAAPIAERAGVTMILEPMNVRVDHKGHCLYGSADAIRICRAVDSKAVKINWDLYHMQISEGDLCGHLREGWDQVGYLQLADHPGRHEPGTGEIHYPRVFRELWELGYRGYVGLECSPSGSELEAARAVARADGAW
jgi:hydroxypyruvate isomerase